MCKGIRAMGSFVCGPGMAACLSCLMSASHKHQFWPCRNTELFLGAFFSHHSSFSSYFLFALPSHWLKPMGKASQHKKKKKKAPHNCSADSSSDQLGLCKEGCQQQERSTASPVITSLSPVPSASLVEFVVTLMNFLLRLHLTLLTLTSCGNCPVLKIKLNKKTRYSHFFFGEQEVPE